MSKLRISGDTSGYYDLNVPDIAGTNTIELDRVIVADASGKVGIGMSSPIANLSVRGGTSNASDLATAYSLAAFNITPKSTSGYSLQFGSGPSDLPYIQMSAGGSASGNLLIQPYGGNVGIGVTSPTNSKLEVVHSSGTLPAGYFYNTSGSGNSPALIARGGANNTGAAHTFEVQDYNGNVDFAISGTGVVTMPNQPAFLAHGNNSNYIPISSVGAGSYVPFANAVTNIGNHYNSSTYQFTAPVAGMYHFSSSVYTRTGNTTEDIYTRWRVNNSSSKGYTYFYNLTGSEIHHTLTESIDIYLNASDYIGVTINGSGTADFYSGFEECRFSGYLIG